MRQRTVDVGYVVQKVVIPAGVAAVLAGSVFLGLVNAPWTGNASQPEVPINQPTTTQDANFGQ